ncbi:3-keto-5-aminohexanoate cleavage protein [Flavonifractor sp. DFI.6.63]|uniref:3-keto-5-aminohexanoate cleavage protein n=1 Tax=Lawsonibacter hominis TaxID=2763053 RepID=A0A8J6MBC3_9FIRM|nr:MULTISPECIES: 3-keto-5-aminohexanoate cleavage protein [Oscillospiraceae]MBC5734914.1 3-keto-5-aminohexanoate cleavage protein [Lawsonibacter hominis]MBS1384706.1 3-keto-5-aminohexanoate cleavage protein [Flavonifractor sp.]MCQ5031134.1 3-keto-5-aminohexanoate cleavage protein [Flavonifractor sp. DFI.6.63]MDU2196410.1 3-keto-5-aminohexanoate cleavage protein [Clostridiales bacterium]
MSDLSNRVILTVAPTGSSTPAAKCPGLPVTPAEIAAETYECWKAGASVVHLHVRDDQGNASMEYEKFRESVALIREKCDIVINMTTAGGFGVPDDERILPLDLIPEMATMDAGSMNVKGDFVFHNSVAFLEKLGRRAQELGIRPEIEVMDTGMVYTALRLIEQGYIKSPPHFQMVLGMENGMAATVENLVYMKNLLPPGATWSAFGVGKAHLTILMATLALGGHVRVGMEDNIYLDAGQKASSNVDFVERTRRIIELNNKRPATPEETRAMLGLRSRQACMDYALQFSARPDRCG